MSGASRLAPARRRRAGAALVLLLGLAPIALSVVNSTAQAAPPSGYSALAAWSVGSPASTTSLPANAAQSGAVRLSSGGQQDVTAVTLDGLAVPRLAPNAAAITGAQNCLAGHTAVGDTNTCATYTATLALPHAAVDSVLAVGIGGGGWSSGGVCSADWEDVSITAIDSAAPSAGQVSAVSIAGNETFSGSTLGLSPGAVLSPPCSSPTSTSTAYLRLNGSATTVTLTFTLRAETTANPGSSTPGISALGGTAVNLSVPGTDLTISNSGPALATPGSAVTWTLTVRNLGPLASHGLVVRNPVPAGVTKARVVSAPPGCALAGNAIVCSVAPAGCQATSDSAVTTLADLRCSTSSEASTMLGAGASLAPIVLSGQAPATANGVLADTATVAGVDGDANTANNSATATTVLQQPTLLLRATASPGSVGVAGAPVTYQYVVTNNGSVGLSGLTVSDTSFSGSGRPTPAVCATTTLAPGASTTCSSHYGATATDIGAAAITSTAVARATPANGTAVTSNPSPSSVLIAPVDLKLVETADHSEITAAGQTVRYDFAVTNVGANPLTGLGIADFFDGTEALPTISCPVQTLQPGQTTTCSTAYTATSGDLTGPARMDNSAIASATTVDGTRTAVSNQSGALVSIKPQS